MKTLTELAQEIERRRDAKKDFVVDTRSMYLDTTGQLVFGDQNIDVNDTAHQQVAAHVGIPKPYYDRMRDEAPDLLANNVNRWFKQYPANRMVRTLDNKARAFLSDRYRPLENEQLAEAVLPVLMDMDLMPIRCEITDRRLYMKFVDKKLQRELPVGQVLGIGHNFLKTTALCPAIVISNSEVGDGALSVLSSVFDELCTNLSVFNDRSVRKSHLGKKHEITEGFEALLTDETRKLSDDALFAQIRDVVKGTFEEAKFAALCDKIVGASQEKIVGDPVKVINLTAKKFSLTDMVEKTMMKHLIERGELSKWGVANAMTRAAQDVEDVDLQNDMERFGGQIINLPNAEWKELAIAA
jgi:hypothetical protein